MKKESQTTQPTQPSQPMQLGGKPILEVKKLELQKVIDESLTQLTKSFQQMQQQMTQQMITQLNGIVQNLSKEVTTKLNQIRAPTVITPTLPAADDQYAKDRLGPRGKKQNPKLPDFWRRNFDYGTGPFSHIDKLKTITDKRKMSKRK